MWTSRRGPQGPNLGHNLMSKKPASTGAMRWSSLCSVVPGKGFGNPNYVNSFDKQSNFNQNNLKSADKCQENTCQNPILDSIKEKCPEVIPSVRDPDAPSGEMCFDHTLNPKPISKQMQRQEMENESFQDLSNHSFSPKPHALTLKDFIKPKPSTRIHLVVGRIDCFTIPIIKGKEMQVSLANSPSPNRTPQYSGPDNEDSFIVFDDDEGEKHTARKRMPSLCESEDSFIMFDRDDEDDDDEAFESNGEDGSEESDPEEFDDSDIDEVDSSFAAVHHKKVRFASNEKLCQVHPMVKWSYAYQAARKGPWEMFARDRGRFRDRILRLERDLKHVFDSQHRDKVYKERFENL